MSDSWNPGDLIEAKEEVTVESVKLSDTKGFHIEVKLRVPFDRYTMDVLGQIKKNGGSCNVSVSHTVPEPVRSQAEIDDERNSKLEFGDEEVDDE
jgi:hypothetical protein